MTDLIIHIGFSKCGSTTLQNEVFKYEKGYLGTHQVLPSNRNFAKQFKSFTPVGPRQWSDFREAQRWVHKLQVSYDKHISRFLLSDEMLTNKNKFMARPIIPFLKKFSNTIWTYGEIKVVLVLRNYAERMASGYAQGAAANPLASQADFEKQVIHTLQKDKTFDYSKWVAELYGTLGKENVCVLLMEEIEQILFWKRLKDFCQLEYFQPTSMQVNRKNSKRKGKNAWVIQSYDPAKKGKTMALKLFGFAWPYYLAREQRSQAQEFTKARLTAYYARKYKHANDNREPEIRLTPELRRQIQIHYRKSTVRLSRLLGKDMAALGY